jgi:hypothetical protein
MMEGINDLKDDKYLMMEGVNVQINMPRSIPLQLLVTRCVVILLFLT